MVFTKKLNSENNLFHPLRNFVSPRVLSKNLNIDIPIRNYSLPAERTQTVVSL